MINDVGILNDLISILDKEKLLGHLVIIGSWAEFLYDKMNIIDNFSATTKTMDIDFLIKNIRKPREKVNIIKLLEDNGFEAQISRINNVTRFIKGEFEVEFLAKSVGKRTSNTVEAPSFGIEVEVMTHMGVMLKNTIEVVYNKKRIQLPSPEAFILGKMVINDRRKDDKKEKDKQAINNMLITIMDSDKHMDELSRIFLTLSLKEQKIVRKYLNDNIIPIEL